MKSRHNKVWIASEVYYPDETATGYLLTQTAEGLAQHCTVGVLCGRSFHTEGGYAPAGEERNGVAIYRCWGTAYDKNKLLLRLINMLTITLSLFFNAFVRVRSGDCVLAVTNPPLLPFAVSVACFLRRARFVLIIHDVYPDVLVATGVASPQSFLVRITGHLNRLLYRRAIRIVVLGRDMQRLVQRKLPPGDCRVAIIENWADLDAVTPQPRAGNPLLAELGLMDKFVVQYAGNMGRTHGLEYIIDCAALLGAAGLGIAFLCIGRGAKRPWLDAEVADRKLENVTIRSFAPREQLTTSLNACDVAIIAFMPGMSGVSVPSRMYNIMAAGKPIIAVTDADSELAYVVAEERIGWIVQPGDIRALRQTILIAAQNPEELAAMGRRARTAAETKYSVVRANHAYCTLVSSLLDHPNNTA
jgi:colanic acid biosynthesis glycosyl transferase WcaI